MIIGYSRPSCDSTCSRALSMAWALRSSEKSANGSFLKGVKLIFYRIFVYHFPPSHLSTRNPPAGTPRPRIRNPAAIKYSRFFGTAAAKTPHTFFLKQTTPPHADVPRREVISNQLFDRYSGFGD